MAYFENNRNPYLPNTSPTRTTQARRSSCQREERAVGEGEIVQGRILWLPPKDELPPRAVRRAHGKGAVEEGIYNHPVVILSRPAHEASIVHFHVITSFQGKKLHEIYGKANEFHASRRSWYLPITPTPPHPDANSKKAKKRFPNLELAGGAVLRWDSYVNLRDVYSIEWSHLRAYGNPDTPYNLDYQFEQDSMTRLLAKGKFLTTYEVGSQVQAPAQPTTQRPLPPPIETTPPITYAGQSQRPRSIASSENSARSPNPQSPFLGSGSSIPGRRRSISKDPRDAKDEGKGLAIVRFIFKISSGMAIDLGKKAVCLSL
ncbi:uncharacterized protein BDR25DRAFT_285340 [Lindgomyces ingoldianus]|uniref:Uncharacterized protein n=1 Tax=Lindgomyces ingoldianus TaxID=673940 RepID=A0ACB6QXI1_9PLEO|nr:uncharacterized protein BDR25DRAFT_285340 [Lindgomyces ingoldianus]KAF2471744.1 hypothetical protein BDR25DRAFT_285340 [Lindgomyces ingoldianus]